MNEQVDDDLIRQAFEGDREAFGMLVERYQKPVYNIALRILHDEADAEGEALVISGDDVLWASFGKGGYSNILRAAAESRLYDVATAALLAGLRPRDDLGHRNARARKRLCAEQLVSA